jgi:copper homeostasis protein
MEADVERAADLGAAGVVIGALDPGGAVDAACTGALVEAARPLSVTFHRAFDMAADPVAAVESLLGLGADRLLTSGQEATALEGAEVIAELVRRCGERLTVMAAGGISERNVSRIVSETGVREVHASLRVSADSAMVYRNPRVSMGGALRPPEFSLARTSAERVQALLQQLP